MLNGTVRILFTKEISLIQLAFFLSRIQLVQPFGVIGAICLAVSLARRFFVIGFS